MMNTRSRLFAFFVAASLMPLSAPAQINLIQAAKDAYNKAKQQQEQGQAGQPQQNQTAAAQPSSAPAQPNGPAPQAGSAQPASTIGVINAAAAQVPPAPPGGLDPSKLPDILGVHVGMPTDQAIKQLNSVYPVVRDRGVQVWGWYKPPSYTKYAATNDPPYISSSQWNRAFPEGCGQGGNGCIDRIDVVFSGPPDQRVVRMQRRIGYQINVPTSDTMKNALIQKFGPNFTEFPQMVLLWAFDEQGKPLALSKNDAQCARNESPISQVGAPGDADGSPGVNHFYSLQSYLGIYTPTLQQQQYGLNNMLRSKCVKGVVVLAEINGQPGGMANGLRVTISEIGADLRNAFAAELYLQQAANAQVNQQLKTDQQTAAPRF